MLRYLSKVKIYTSFLPFLPFHRNLAFSTQALNTTKSHIENCYGCNSILQSIDKTKYGYIEETVLQSTVSQNKANLQKFYSDKIQNEDAKTYQFLREIQKQENVVIFNPNTNEVQELQNIETLIKLQQKIQKYQKSQQILKKSPKLRQNLLCYRCFCLRFHNRLPQQYDYEHGFSEEKEEFVIRKIINKHKNYSTQFLYVVDVFDILGTFQQKIFKQLLASRVNFSIVVNKIDIVNQKYLNMTMIHAAIREKVNKALSNLNYEHQPINYFFVSSISKNGVNKLQKHIQSNKNNVQLIGYPNTGKTTLLNLLTKLKKSTSKIPGTTVRVTQHFYQQGQRRKIYDMPGLHSNHLLYNFVKKLSQKSLLAWTKKFSPGILTHSAFIFGGKVQIQGVRIIIFGQGGACSSDNKWFIKNYKEFWKGLPEPSLINIQRYQIQLEFKNGKTQDLQIAGYGFIGFKLCQESKKNVKKKLILYLPKEAKFDLRQSILGEQKIFHNKSALAKRFMLERLYH